MLNYSFNRCIYSSKNSLCSFLESDLDVEAVGLISTSESSTSSFTTHPTPSAAASGAPTEFQTALPDLILSSGSRNSDKLGLDILSTVPQLWESSISRQEGSTSLEIEDTVTVESGEKQLHPTKSEDSLVSGVSLATTESPQGSNTSQLPTDSSTARYRTSDYRVYLDTATTGYEEASGHEPDTVTATLVEDVNASRIIEEENKVNLTLEEEIKVSPTLEETVFFSLEEELKVAPTFVLEEANAAPTLAFDEEADIAPTLSLEEETSLAPTHEEGTSVVPTLEEEADIVPTLALEEEASVAPTHEEEINIASTLEEEASVDPTLEEEARVDPTLEEEANVAPTFEEDFTVFPVDSQTSTWAMLTTTTGPQESLNDLEYSTKMSSTTSTTAPDSSSSTKPTAATTKTTTISTTTRWSRRPWSPTTSAPNVFRKTAEPQKVTPFIPPVDQGLVDVEFSLTQPPTLLILPNERAAVGGTGKVSGNVKATLISLTVLLLLLDAMMH